MFNSVTHGEVSLSVGVFNVEPDDVHRIVQLLEHALHCRHVTLVTVIPPTLVVTCEKKKENKEFTHGECDVQQRFRTDGNLRNSR